jgi:hypothetical protein
MDFRDCNYIVNERGKKTGVILSIEKYHSMLKKLEELETTIACDKAKSPKGRVLDFREVIRKMENKHRK